MDAIKYSTRWDLPGRFLTLSQKSQIGNWKSKNMLIFIRCLKEKIIVFAVVIMAFLQLQTCVSQVRAQEKPITRAEILRGTITPEREWWDVMHYDLSVQFMPATRSIKGSNVITFKALKPGSRMQIDLQAPLNITRIDHGGTDLKFEREGNVFWVTFDKEIPQGVEDTIQIFYEG